MNERKDVRRRERESKLKRVDIERKKKERKDWTDERRNREGERKRISKIEEEKVNKRKI